MRFGQPSEQKIVDALEHNHVHDQELLLYILAIQRYLLV